MIFLSPPPEAEAYLEHTYTKKMHLLFIINSHLTGHPVFYLATLENTRIIFSTRDI